MFDHIQHTISINACCDKTHCKSSCCRYWNSGYYLKIIGQHLCKEMSSSDTGFMLNDIIIIFNYFGIFTYHKFWD